MFLEGSPTVFVVLSEIADVIYKCTDHYAPGDEYGVFWADNAIDIKWPLARPILSKKDSENPLLTDIDDSHLPLYAV